MYVSTAPTFTMMEHALLWHLYVLLDISSPSQPRQRVRYSANNAVRALGAQPELCRVCHVRRARIRPSLAPVAPAHAHFAMRGLGRLSMAHRLRHSVCHAGLAVGHPLWELRLVLLAELGRGPLRVVSPVRRSA